jgi:membrane protease YdiL (CAAX protease family)
MPTISMPDAPATMEHLLDYATDALGWLLLVGSLIVWARLFERRATGAPLVDYEPRQQVPWRGFDLIVLGLVALVLQAGAELAVGGVADGESAAMSTPAIAAMVVVRLVWFVFAVVYLVRASGAYAEDLGFDARRLAGDLRLAGGTFLAAVIPVYGIQWLLTDVFKFKSAHPLVVLVQERPGVGVLLLATFAAAVVAPLVEEFLFRVVLQGWLEQREIDARVRRGGDPDAPAGFGPIVAAGTIFALLHVTSGIDWVALLVLSLFLGYVYQRTHRFIVPFAVHFLVNALAMLHLWKLYFAGGG